MALLGSLLAAQAVPVSAAGSTTSEWAIAPSPVTSATFDVLAGVSCTGKDSCVAVGEYAKPGFYSLQTLVEVWNGSTWSVVPSPSPGSFANYLFGVSCTSRTFCKAVGFSAENTMTMNVLIESWDGSSWSQTSTSTVGMLRGVSCTSDVSCVAVGSTSQQTLVESWNGATWSVVPSPSPGVVQNDFYGVSCLSTSDCVAVGDTDNGGGTVFRTLVASWNGLSWTVVPSPNETNGNNILYGVSCNGPSSCAAVGDDDSQGMIQSWDGSSWSIAFIHNGGSAGGVYPRGISCSNPHSCVAVDTSAIESWDGSAWSVAATFSSQLNGVSCTTPTSCVVVGSSPNLIVTGPHGYWQAGGDGGVFSFGSTQFYGSTGARILQRPVVAIATTADRAGYWLVGTDGGLFAFGDARYFGSIPGLGILPARTPGPGRHLNAPVVDLAPSADGAGYFMVGADGGVYAFGDAPYLGSLPQIEVHPAAPIVGIAPSGDAHGYFMVGADGGVYAFGDAPYLGSLPQIGVHPAAPIVGIAPSADAQGYWLVGADGGVYAFGDAPALGSLSQIGVHPAAPIVGMAGL
jgi:hypothetical protein